MSLILAIAALMAALRIAAGVAGRMARWRRAGAAPVVWAGLLQVPRRYLVDVHEVVHRVPRNSRMHVLAAGGLVAALVLSILLWWSALTLVAGLLLGAVAASAIGLAMAWQRRHPRPAHLSDGPATLLPVWLGCGLLALGWWGVRVFAPNPMIDTAAVILGGVALVMAAGGLGDGAMKHALYGVLNLAFHPRAGRFGVHQPERALRPLDLSAPKLGVAAPEDFAWNRLLNFDACVECGRCELACPAFAAGQPLNPKALVHALAHAEGPIVGGAVTVETLWSCTTCSACVTECPMMVEHVDAVVDLRRDQTLMQGAAPARVARFLEDLSATGNTAAADPARRLDWASDLGVKVLAPGEHAEVLLWTGDGAFAARNQVTLRALVKLLQRAGVQVAVAGTGELHCGDAARRLGDEALFQRQAGQVAALLGGLRFDRIVTVDPHVVHAIGQEYPALGHHFAIEHHATFLARLVEDGRLRLDGTRAPQRLTYHDPCYLGRYGGEYAAPRSLLKAAGFEIAEMERSGRTSRCCGAGGGAAVADMPGERRIPDMRVDDARAVGADMVAVACPNCMTMLDGVVHPRPDVRDIAEVLLERVAS